eukprot:365732-Chlamydomonas_euryale.AAC.2
MRRRGRSSRELPAAARDAERQSRPSIPARSAAPGGGGRTRMSATEGREREGGDGGEGNQDACMHAEDADAHDAAASSPQASPTV